MELKFLSFQLLQAEVLKSTLEFNSFFRQTYLVMKKALDLIFPQEQIKNPVIYKMAREFDVIFNLKQAKVNETVGEIVLELEGESDIVDQAVAWLKSQGLKVQPITKDTLES